MHAELHDPDLDLTALARACNVSAGHLVRVFRRETGLPPMEYLWQRRVSVGVDLLANTGLPVGAIAARYADLRERLPRLTVVGGCCGTDHRHVGAIRDACLASPAGPT